MVSRRIAIVSTNYHPRTCGVGDNSMRLGQALQHTDADVCIFTQAPAEPHPEAPHLPVRTITGLSPVAVARAMGRSICEWGASDVVLQYVPRMLGASRFGSPAAPLLAHSMHTCGARVVAVCHELYLSWAVRPDLALGAAVNRIQLAWLLAAVDRLAVTTEARRQAVAGLARVVGRESRLALLPVGSNALPIPARPSLGRFHVGVFSTLAAGKRFDVVLDAFERLVTRIPTAQLVLLGDFGVPGNSRLRELAERIRRGPIAGSVRVTGKLPLAEVAEEVARLDAFFFPMDVGATTRSSTLPLPLGAGVPVVAWKGPDTSDLFVAEENVVFARELSGEAFAQAALRLRADPELSRRVAEGGTRLYREYLAWPTIAARLLDLLGPA